MNVELNRDELNLLIECITFSKDSYLETLDSYWDESFALIGDITDTTDFLNSLYNLKFKLCNYSVELQEEN